MCLLAVVGLGCARQQRAPSQAAPAPAAALASPPAQGGLTSDERIKAGQLIQKLHVGSHGPLEVRDIGLESGVIRARVAPLSPGTKAFDVHVTRDLRLLFPVAQDPNAVLQAAAADREFGACLRAKGLRVYGDPGQSQTQRQMAELGAHAQQVLLNCAATPADCTVLGQTSLPVVQYGAQRVASFVPRAVIGQWTGCKLPPQPAKP